MAKRTEKKYTPDLTGTSLLQVRLDRELHGRFKAFCALKGISMQDKVLELIKDAMKGGA